MTKHHPASRRPQEGQLDEDAFVAKTVSAAQWAQDNRGLLVSMVAILVVIVGGIWYYVDSRAAMVASATYELEEIRGAMMFGDPQTAAGDLTRFITRFDGTPQAAEGRLLLGRQYLDGEDPEAAVTALEPVGSDPAAGPLSVQAAFLLAKAYEAADRLEDAEALYLRISSTARLNFQIWDALAYAAGIRADQGELQGAADLYRQILGLMDEADQSRGVYEMRLAELETRARG